MRTRLVLVLLVAGGVGVGVGVGGAASPVRTVSAAGVSVQLPAGWVGRRSSTPGCDPRRLLVASSSRPGVRAGGGIAAAARGQVIVAVMEDVQVQDRPVGDLRRPRHFQIDWSSLRILAPDGFCGNPKGPAVMHYFKTRGRYLGFIVYPGRNVTARTRAQTLALMDSLRVAA
jgi:hypothetical protein